MSAGIVHVRADFVFVREHGMDHLTLGSENTL